MSHSEANNLEHYREYLRLLGRMQLSDELAGKVDISGVVQETMLEAHQQQDAWQALDEAARIAWIRRVFAHNLLDEIRRFRTQARDVARERSLEAALEQSASRLSNWIASDQSSPSEHAMREERAVRLAHALACLSPEQRQAVELHHLQGLSLLETADRLNRQKGAVAALIYRGLRRLRELLSSHVGDTLPDSHLQSRNDAEKVDREQ